MSRLHPWIARAEDEAPVTDVGGKAFGLGRLVGLGLPVPRFVVLTTEAYRACCPRHRVPDAEDSRLSAALDAVWSELSPSGAALAVRSSAVAEDDVTRSWAGQMETFLNVRSREALGEKVLECWRSLHGERATRYRGLGGETDAEAPRDDAMGVVIQEMLVPDASGVLFTLDPVSGRRDRMVASAVLGVGEGLVSGTLDADTYVVDRAGEPLERRVVAKSERVEAAPEGGTRQVPVPEGEADAPALTDALLRELAERAAGAEEAAGHPLDIEFAVAGGKLFFLQARPVTAAGSGSATGPRLLWDNANIVESYPGVTLPLTFSFIRRAYHAVYWQFCQLLGMGEDEIRANDHMLWNMLGLHQGRVYYNLRNWYKLVSILPGFRQNRRFMEGMMGVTHEGGDESDDRVSRSAGAWALAVTAVRAVWLQATLARRIRAFHADFDRIHGEFAAQRYEAMEPGEILEEYRRVERALLWRWKAPIVNDFSVMVFYGLLERLTVEWGVDPQGNLQNALVAEQGGIESTAVSERLEELAEAVADDPALADAVLERPPSQLFDLVRAHPVCGALLERYMERFGDRCVAELKLESRSMHDDPLPLMAALQASVRRGAQGRPEAGRTSLMDEARAAVRSALSWWQRPIYAWVLRNARRGIRNRENQRLARTRAFALVRRMMRSVGTRFAELGLLERADDVFYLELDELMRLSDGTATLADPRAVVEARAEQFGAFRDAPPLPDRFSTVGVAAVSPRYPETAGAAADGADGLSGLAAYPGLVEARAVVMDELDATVPLDGEILVTRQTDPGWVILFPAIGGLVVERGSMLSHSAIVAREMGIPAVVGVRGAMGAIETGDLLRLDGGAGTVRVLEKAPPEPEP